MKQLLVLLMLLCSTTINAQDVIVKKDGSTIVCRVVEVNSSEIVYKKWTDLNGSNYVMDRSLASAINYENGKTIKLSETDNLYKPGNQNSGVQTYNDNALLRIDAAVHKSPNAHTLRTIAWIGGVVLVGGGLAFNYIAYPNDDNQHIIGYLLAGGGIVWTSAFLFAANKAAAKERLIGSTPFYFHQFKIGNASSLITSIDLLKNNMDQTQTLGIGLRYNF